MADHLVEGGNANPVFEQFKAECEAKESSVGKQYVILQRLEEYDSEDEDSTPTIEQLRGEGIGSYKRASDDR